MARTSPANTSSGASPRVQHIGIWLQYKGTRARTLQVTKHPAERDGLASKIIDEFLADLEALALTMPGFPMVDIRIIWGTGQIRARYGLNNDGLRFNVIVKYLVKRARTRFLDRLSERSIARIYYIEDGSPVEIDNLPLGPPPLPRPLSPLSSQPQAGTSNMLSIPQSPAITSSGALYHTAPYAQPSLASSSKPPIDRSQVSNGTHRLPPSSGQARAHQTPPPQSLPSAPPYPHPARQELPLHLTTTPTRLSNRTEGSRDPRVRLSIEDKVRTAEPETTLDPRQRSSKTLATAAALSTSLLSSDAGPSQASITRPVVPLTRDVCARLKDHADGDVLSTSPVLKVLVLRSVDGPDNGAIASKSHEAFVTDGRGYLWVALASSATERIGNRDDRRSLQVGSSVRLKRMSRLPSVDLCPILVHDIEVADSTSDERSAAVDRGQGTSAIKPDIPSSTGVVLPIALSPQVSIDCPSGQRGALVHCERAARLLADAKFQEERRRRIVLESALADVCGDLHRLESLNPATVEALRKIDELAGTAMSA